MKKNWTRWIGWFLSLVSINLVSLIGAAFCISSLFLILISFLFDPLGSYRNPYVGVITFLALPLIFGLGLFFLIIGLWRRRKRISPRQFPVIDLNESRVRQWVFLFFVGMFFSLVLLSLSAYQGMQVMNEREFCGETCHDIMKPQYVAHQKSPHSEVLCVSCHVIPGAEGFLRSKILAVHQVLSTFSRSHPRPIFSPMRDLVPSKETCERCHRSPGEKIDPLKIVVRYEEDEMNSKKQSVFWLHVGPRKNQENRGIHWHIQPESVVRYRMTENNSTIHEIFSQKGTETSKTFYLRGQKPMDSEGLWRTMDCLDCHNRTGHESPTVWEVVDEAMEEGGLDSSLPWIRKNGRKLLEDWEFSGGLKKFYEENPISEKNLQIEKAEKHLQFLHAQNVFPPMKVKFGTYPDHSGHEQSPGCFRCHNGLYETSEGRKIPNDCEVCHKVLAYQESGPLILNQLQLSSIPTK